jgi:hypothetical protein
MYRAIILVFSFRAVDVNRNLKDFNLNGSTQYRKFLEEGKSHLILAGDIANWYFGDSFT